MQSLLSHDNGNIVNPCNPVNPADLLREWGVTTLPQWLKLPVEKRRKTITAAINLPYEDTPRGHETALVKPGKGE